MFRLSSQLYDLEIIKPEPDIDLNNTVIEANHTPCTSFVLDAEAAEKRYQIAICTPPRTASTPNSTLNETYSPLSDANPIRLNLQIFAVMPNHELKKWVQRIEDYHLKNINQIKNDGERARAANELELIRQQHKHYLAIDANTPIDL